MARLVVLLLLAGCGPDDVGRSSVLPASPEPVHERPRAAGDAAGRADGVPADAQRALVVRHTDGDTLRLVGTRDGPLPPGSETTVRLLAIDAPESVHPGQPRECYGEESAGRLAQLAPLGAAVWVTADREPVDRYRRTLLYVWTADGDLVNEVMVRGGHATAVLYPPNDRHIDRLRAAEASARAAGRGLWRDCQ